MKKKIYFKDMKVGDTIYTVSSAGHNTVFEVKITSISKDRNLLFTEPIEYHERHWKRCTGAGYVEGPFKDDECEFHTNERETITSFSNKEDVEAFLDEYSRRHGVVYRGALKENEME